MDTKLKTLTEFHRFLELPRDVIKLLMLKYFDPITALRCLRVCKYFNNILLNFEVSLLRVGVIKYIAYENQVISGVTKLPIRCQLCGVEITEKGAGKHAAKHKKRYLAGKPIPRIRDIYVIPEPCHICDAPFPERGPHSEKGCPLVVVKCKMYKHIAVNPWAESTCLGAIHGYRKQMQHHDCAFRCKSCKKLFKLDVNINDNNNGFHRHLRICEYKMEIITLWGITLSNR